ncbi:ParB/RepB/Spo0J family partition protein [Phenylobacterium sp.]|uniref:ParB/RepB/Spo0J family partition protein n=1 Tax=Phenylobacterium sp. TaxID=1871053 RepID=UPI00392032B4
MAKTPAPKAAAKAAKTPKTAKTPTAAEPTAQAPSAPDVAPDTAAVELPLHLIDDNPDNPRGAVDEEADAELTASIGARGVLQPIMVRPNPAEPGRYLVVMGARRRACSLAAGKLTIPAVIREGLDDDQAFELATIENVARNNMSAMDDARAYRRMIDKRMQADPNLTLKAAKEAVSLVVGKSVRIIELRLEFLEKLPPIKVTELERGKISAKEATEWIRKQPKPLTLPAAEWLLALEVFDKVKADPIPRTDYMRDRLTECHADARFDEDGRIKRLTEYPNQLLTTVSHVLDDGGETGRFQIGVSWEAERHLELKFGDLKTASQRLHAMDGLRQELGLRRLDPGYSTPWLNGPFEVPDSIKDEIKAARNKRAQERAERVEQDAAREREAAARQAAAEAEKDAEKAFLDAVMQLEADIVAEIATQVRDPEADQSLTEDEFRRRFRELWTGRGVKGPFTIQPGENPRDDATQLVDGEGRPNMDRGAGLEGRRRLMALALNFAGGWALSSGPLFRTPWNPDAPAAKAPPEILPRDRFVAIVADCLGEDCEDLPEDPSEALFEATERAGRGLDAFLAQEGIDYGADGYDWAEDGAMQLAELVRVEGLGQDSKPPAADEPAGEEAQAEDAEIPGFLRRLAGAGEGAEAQP